MLAKKTSKNQITLPKAAIAKFKDVEYFDVTVKDGRIVLEPVKITLVGSTLQETRKKIANLGLSEKDVDDAVAWARGR